MRCPEPGEGLKTLSEKSSGGSGFEGCIGVSVLMQLAVSHRHTYASERCMSARLAYLNNSRL